MRHFQLPALRGLQAHEFYEMMTVRHGFMLVGLSYSGKSTIIQAVAQALGILHERGQQNEQAVLLNVINPKAIYMGQLYGQFDPVSHEWQDGVLARIFRCLLRLPPSCRPYTPNLGARCCTSAHVC